MPPRLKGGASQSLQTERLASEAGNVDGGVTVAVVDRPAVAADPLPYVQIPA
jgi:hypothetical protein